uniref:Carbonic anhydrase n=1 Tax=Colletotrichum fructicola (strain Nara gc5) TaxID=1213859 RepID=L2FIE6_COLFN
MFKSSPVPRSLLSSARLGRPLPPRLFPNIAALRPHHLQQQHASFSKVTKPIPEQPDFDKMAENDIEKYLKQTHDRVFEHNKAWAEQKKKEDPNFFVTLSAGQTRITGLGPGEAFVHRNIANLVNNIDLNVMSVINYAAAMTPKDLGLLNPWLRNIRDVYRFHEAELDAIKDEEARYDRLVELNVIEQCRNVIKTAAIQQSYAKNKFPIVHGWVFGFNDGLLKDLKIDHESMLHDIQKIYHLPDA